MSDQGRLITLQEARDDIHQNVDTILETFREQTRTDPWIKLPEGYRADCLHEVIRCVASLALSSPDDEELEGRRQEMLRAAARHGEERLRQGFPDSILFHEIYLLRNGMWRFINDRHGIDRVAVEAIGHRQRAVTRHSGQRAWISPAGL